MKRRLSSLHVLLAAIGSVAALPCCDDDHEDLDVYPNVSECAKHQPILSCQAAYAAAMAAHRKDAPKYDALETCKKDFEGCEASGEGAQELASGKTVDANGKVVTFSPPFAGFTVPREHHQQRESSGGGGGDTSLIIIPSVPIYHPLAGGYSYGSGVHVTNNYGSVRAPRISTSYPSSPLPISRTSSFSSSAPASFRSSTPAASITRGTFGSTARSPSFSSASSVGG